MATQSRLATSDSITGDWTHSSGATDFEMIDDPVGAPDDAATYLNTIVSISVETFFFSAFSLPASSTVSKVEVMIRGKATGDATIRGVLRNDNGTHFYTDGLPTPLTASYADYVATWAINPATGVAWTQAEVERTGGANTNIDRFGIAAWPLTSGSVQVTQAYILVTYSTGGTPSRNLTLLNVG